MQKVLRFCNLHVQTSQIILKPNKESYKSWHGVKVGPGTGTSGPGPSSKFKSGTPGPLSKIKKGTQIMVFLHCFTLILYENLRNFFKEVTFHKYSPSHILCSELIHHFHEKRSLCNLSDV